MKNIAKILISLFLLLGAAAAQQDQVNYPPNFDVNSFYIQGIAPGYRPSKGAGLTLNIAKGTVNCSGTRVAYAGGTLTMTNSATNYVYLDPAASCAPASNTTGYPAGSIWIGTVVASGGTLANPTDDRSWFAVTNISFSAASPDAVQKEQYTYAADSGSANAYAVTLAPVPSLVAGSVVQFKATNANTTTSTLVVNGGSAITIKKNGSTNLVSGDIAAGQIVTVIYDGTNFQMQTGTPSGTGNVTGSSLTNNQVICGAGSSAIQTCDLTGDVTTSGSKATTLGSSFKIRGIPFTIGTPGGTALTAGASDVDYITVPFACTIAGYNLVIDTGTITVKFWKKATGTAIPTSSDSISTSGVGISSGTAIHSTTTSDFTTTTVTANDIMAMKVTAVSSAAYVQGVLQCNQ